MQRRTMENPYKKALTYLFILVGLCITGYLGYRAYHYAINAYNQAVDDAAERIKEKVKEGASEGVEEGAGKVLNPLTLPTKILRI